MVEPIRSNRGTQPWPSSGQLSHFLFYVPGVEPNKQGTEGLDVVHLNNCGSFDLVSCSLPTGNRFESEKQWSLLRNDPAEPVVLYFQRVRLCFAVACISPPNPVFECGSHKINLSETAVACAIIGHPRLVRRILNERLLISPL